MKPNFIYIKKLFMSIEKKDIYISITYVLVINIVMIFITFLLTNIIPAEKLKEVWELLLYIYFWLMLTIIPLILIELKKVYTIKNTELFSKLSSFLFFISICIYFWILIAYNISSEYYLLWGTMTFVWWGLFSLVLYKVTFQILEKGKINLEK